MSDDHTPEEHARRRAEAQRIYERILREHGRTPINPAEDVTDAARTLGMQAGESLDAFITRARYLLDAIAAHAGHALRPQVLAMLATERTTPMELSAQQKQICRALGIDETAYAAALEQPASHGLTSTELDIAARLGITAEQYAKAKSA